MSESIEKLVVRLEKRGCDILDDSDVIRMAKKGGITNHRYRCEIKQPRKGRERQEQGVYFEFTFHDWSENQYTRNHIQAQGLNPDAPHVHAELAYYDMEGMCHGVVKRSHGWIECSMKAIQTFIRRHGFPNAVVEVVD